MSASGKRVAEKIFDPVYIEGMNRESLEKSSKDELISLVMKQGKPKKKVKFTIPNKFKNSISKYKSSRDKLQVITYGKKPVSLAEFRHEELELANITPNTLGTSFLTWFQSRLNNLPNDRENVQITLFVDIGNIIETKVRGKDEEEITKHMITQPKSYGSFKTSVPKLHDEDLYKFMVYTLIKNNFTLLSAQTITAIG